MKQLTLIFSMLFCLVLTAQDDCKYYQKYIDAGDLEIAKGDTANFRQAINDYSTAMVHCEDKTEEASNKIIFAFERIEALKKSAEAARKEANANFIKARIAEINERNQREIALIQKDSVQQLKSKADSLYENLKEETEKVKYLIDKGQSLEKTFSTDSTYQFLFKTGLNYFKFDTISQSRDYYNALTYFALARFLKPNDILDKLIKVTEHGKKADEFFFNGELEPAKANYQKIINTLTSSGFESKYEKWRIKHIKEVAELFSTFSKKYASNPTTNIELKGNWWTIPNSFRVFQKISSIDFIENDMNFKIMPKVLSQLGNLKHLKFQNCKNIVTLNDWTDFSYIQSIHLTDNPSLNVIEKLETIPTLNQIEINNCTSLTTILGAKKLLTFSIEACPFADISEILSDNKGITKLTIADLENMESINSENMPSLKHMNLSNIKINKLNGLNKNIRLDSLKLDNLDNLKSISLPSHLRTIYLKNCREFEGFENWEASNNLQKVIIVNNSKISKLPVWSKYPNIERTLIQDNANLKHLGGVRDLTKAENILIINNPKVISNSINLTFTLNQNLFKRINIEFEHRRPIGSYDVGFKVGTLLENKFSTVELGAVYYLPLNGYIGAGVGLLKNQFNKYGYRDTTIINPNLFSFIVDTYTTNTPSYNFIYVLNFGIQLSPRFLKHDKIALSGAFRSDSFEYVRRINVGVTYFHFFGFNKKTNFIRPFDNRKRIKLNKRKQAIDNLVNSF